MIFSRHLLLSLLLSLAIIPLAHSQCIPEADTARILPSGYVIPEGNTATISLSIPPRSGTYYTLYHNEQVTDQIIEGTSADSLTWSVAETGVYTVLAQQGDCQQMIPGYCVVRVQATSSSLPRENVADDSAGKVPPLSKSLPLGNGGGVGDTQTQTTNNNTDCECLAPSMQSEEEDLCGHPSVTLAVAGGPVVGFYSLLRDGNLVRTTSMDDCNNRIILWENVTVTGLYSVQGPGSCPVTGTTRVIDTDACNPPEDCGSGAEIAWPSTSPPPTNLCQGSSVTLTASKDRNYYRWYYVPPFDNSGTLGEPISSSKSITVQESGTYVLRTRDDCQADYEAQIPITFKPTIGGFTLEGSTVRCQSTTQYVASARHSGPFQWDISELGAGNSVSYVTSTSGDQLTETATVTWASGFSGNAVLRVSTNGCAGTTASRSITIASGVSAGPDLTVYHKGPSVSLHETNAPPGTWSVSPSSASAAISDDYFDPGHPSVTPRTYTLTFTSLGDCQASDTRTITVQSLTNNYNYVAHDIFRVNTTPGSMNGLSASDRSRSYTYLDGLGRSTIALLWQGSPGRKDQVQATVYDDLGRQPRQYLPYALGTSGHYQSNNTLSFYDDPPAGVTSDSKPYASIDYEDSPLSRPLTTAGPGNAWHSANKKTTSRYQVNSGSDVRKLRIGTGENDLPISQGFYSGGELFMNITIDEDNRQVRTYTNRSGETVLRQVQQSGGWLLTYYVYDDFGNLRYVLPPKAVQQIGSTFSGTAYQNTLKQLAFQYVYDQRQRMIFQRVPGVDTGTEMVYDRRDRLVLSRNARQAQQGQWSFIKYDALNRPVMTGAYANGSSRNALQSSADSVGLSESRTGGTVGYTLNESFPTNVTESDVRTITYYDDYGFTSYSYGGTKQNKPVGQVTGSRTRVLGSNQWLVTVVFYDDRYRPAHAISENHKGGTDKITHTYDFVGNVLTTIRVHSNSNLTVQEIYDYDHQDRLLNIQHRINSGAPVTVAEYKYNELGQLIEKNLHRRGSEPFAQSVDYRYTIRGWLKSINNSTLENKVNNNPDPASQPADLFGAEFLYEQNTLGLPTP